MSGRPFPIVRITIALLLGWHFHAQCASPPSAQHFKFREPRRAGYNVEGTAENSVGVAAVARPQWLKAWPDNGSTNYVHLGHRIVLQLRIAADLEAVLKARPVRLARTINEKLFILEADDAWTALREAEQLAEDARVITCYPVTRRPKQLHGPYAARPNDPFFAPSDDGGDGWQAYLENRDSTGAPLGIDLNVRAAWPVSQGQGVLLAIADDGFELEHADLVDRTQGAPHFNFVTGQADGMPAGIASFHGTAVAGLAAATSNNGIGISGVAPLAQLASFVVFGRVDNIASEEALMDMFQYQSNIVAVQNHSWGKVGTDQVGLTFLEDLAISNAVKFGRSGRGVVMVRAGGNGRTKGGNANDDGYVADPRVIAVAAVRLDGRPAGYSSPGACILVAAPGGDQNAEFLSCLPPSPNLVTTDRAGTRGYNRDSVSVGGGDYTYGVDGFNGTSASTPQISGVAALILGANPNLTYRDVQQILVHSSRLPSMVDPTVATNGAGFVISHNLGFGVPDSGMAVALAQTWRNRPAARTVTVDSMKTLGIPDLGFRLRVEGADVPLSLRSVVALPGAGAHPFEATPLLGLVDAGEATVPITEDLRGRAALIQRGANYFCEKIDFATTAGAGMAVIYNNQGEDLRVTMVGTDLAMIPAVFINQNDGEALRDYLAADPSVRVQLTLDAATETFHVDQTLQCEFVGVRLDSDHSARGDLRIVLTSPSGTRSVLQHVNPDNLPGPRDWTYYSVHHFYESSYGAWTLQVVDEDDRGTGSLISATLIITGVPITDTDHDGLDDTWEREYFSSLAQGPADDPDLDAYSNVREQIMGTDPRRSEDALTLDLSLWDNRLARLSWPSNTNTVYQIQSGSESVAALSLTTNLVGRIRETEWFIPYTNGVHQFFRVQALPKGR